MQVVRGIECNYSLYCTVSFQFSIVAIFLILPCIAIGTVHSLFFFRDRSSFVSWRDVVMQKTLGMRCGALVVSFLVLLLVSAPSAWADPANRGSGEGPGAL